MKRKFVNVAIFATISIAIWMYWSTNTNTNKNLLIIKRNNYNFRGIMIKPNTTCEKSPFLVILVTSYVGHVELRSAHRRAMPSEQLNSMNIKRVFLVARIPENEKYITQEALVDESDTFGDILQGTFIENYRNLTYKHLMGLSWASSECSKATFILKVDDDTVFNLKMTYQLLRNTNHLDNTLMGYMLNHTKPRRNKENKWYVTWDEYPRNEYPPYLSGWYYITTPVVAGRICEEAVYHPKFWIDDILITGLLTEALKIELKQLPENYWLEYYELLECCLRDMINKSIICEYVVGPNGGRNNLIYEFNEALNNCDNHRNCTKRMLAQSLNRVCVAYRERSIFSDGQAEIQNIKL